MGVLSCSFFGHRKIESTSILKQKLKHCIESLIINHNVERFLFGSNSEFNDLCYTMVSQLKEIYPSIKRIRYTCKSESCTLEIEREKFEKMYSQVLNKEIHLFGFEAEIEHKTKYNAGKASYVERNQAMIDDSCFCIFYYNKNYVPPTKTNSGTQIAYNYAIKKKKRVLNLYD